MKRNPLRTWLPYAFAAIVAPLIAAWPQRAQAANLYWDGTDTTLDADGGAGTWTTANAWDTLATAGADASWSSVTPDAATFGGVAGTVTVSAATTVAGITFTTTGYTIAGAGPLTLSTSTIATGANDATISAILAGTTTVTKTGTGVLTLSGTNTTTGAFTISGGTVKLGSALALGTSAGGATVASGAVLDLNGQTVVTEAATINGTGIASGGALINSSATAGSWSGTVAMASASSIGGTGAMTLSGIVSGGFALTKVGTNTVTLGGANTYTGVTNITSGTLVAQANLALGTTAGGTVISSGASLNLGGTLGGNALNLGTEAISVSGAGVGGLGAIIATGTNGQQNAIGGAVTMTGATTFGGTQRWDIRNGSLNGGGFNLTKIGTNSVFLSGTSQMSNLGQILIQNGEFVMETGAVATSANTSGILVQPATAVTAAFRSWGSQVNHTANITLDSTFAGSVARLEVQNGITTHSGTVTAVGGDNRLDVDGNQVMIADGVLAGAGTFRKEDNGLLLVNNAGNTHNGAFIVNGGTLGGVGTLGSSSVTLNNGATLSPGFGSTSAGNFTVSNAIVSNGTNSAVFNLGATNDLVNAGTLTQNGSTNIAVTNGPGTVPGVYTLYNYTNPINGTNGFGGFTLGGSHVDGTLSNTGSSIQLTLNSVNPTVWTGASNGQWNTGTPNNPSLPNFSWAAVPGGRVESLANDNVRFDDTNTGRTTIVVNGTVTPSSLIFDHSALNYTLDTLAAGQSGGNIAGTTGLTKSGSGTLTLLGAPTFTGPVNVTGGTLQLGNDSRVGTLTGGNTSGTAITGTGPNINLAAGTTLGIAVGNNVDTNYGNNISGAGNIVLNATQGDTYFNYTADRGAVRIFGDNAAFTGTWTVKDGNRLRVDSLTALGASTGLTIEDGGQILTNIANFNSAVPITVQGKGWSETAGQLGAIRLFSNGVLSGPVTLTGNTRITAFNSSGTLSGVISGNHAVEFGFNHTGTTSGTLNGLNGANTYTGNTSITRMTITGENIANSGAASSLGAGAVVAMDASAFNVTGAGAMTTDRTFTLGAMGIGASSIGVINPATTLTFTGAINNVVPLGGSSAPFRQGLNFQQFTTAGTGGTVVLTTAAPIITSGTTVHRQNLTLAGNTNFTVGASGFGTAGTFNVGNSTGTDVGNATLNIQDNAVLTVLGDFDIGNQGAAQTYVVNQSGTSTVNALRGGGIGSEATGVTNNNNRGMRVGHWGAENSTYNLTGGTLNVPNGHLYVGYDGQGTFNQSAGTTVNAIGLRMIGLNNSATAAGTYNLNGGTLNVGAYGFAKGGTVATVPVFNLNGGTYRATADHSISSNIAINVQNGGGTIDTNGFTVTSGSRLIGTGTGTVTKAGLGEFVLPSGNQDYTGATNIDGGTLTLGAAGSLITASSSVNVGARGTLAGTGGVSAAGGVTVSAGGILSPGLSAGAGNGTLTLSNATLAAGSFVDITPAAAGGDLLAVTANLTGATTFNVLPVVGTTPLAAGTYTLATAGSTAGLTAAAGAFPHLADGSAPPALTINPTSVTATLSAAADPMIWSGAAGANWNTATANQWNGLSGLNNAASFNQGDMAVFNDSSSVGGVTVQAAGVRPADLSFNNSITAYTLTGGAITGGASVTKAGTASTIFANNNNYTGTTTISAGTLQVGNGGTAGTLGLGNVTNNAVLSFNRSDASSYNGVISGTGSVRSDGTGITTLGALTAAPVANTYSGGTVISKGTLQGNHNSFGAGNITLNDAATGAENTGLLFQNGATQVVVNNIVVANLGTGTATIGSSEDSLVGSGLQFTGTLQLDRPTRLLGELDRTTFSGVVSGNVGTLSIGRSTGLKDFEQGRVVLEKDNTFTGNVVVENFTNLQINDISNVPANAAKNQIPDTASVTLGDTSWLTLADSGSADDSETIGDLISSSSTSRVRSLNAGSVLTYGTANNATFNGVVDGANTFDLIKQGTGTQTFGGSLDNGSGRMIVNAGTVILAKDSSNTVHAVASLLTINSGATVQLGGTYTEYRDAEDTNRNNVTQTYPGAPANFVDQIYNDLDVTVNAGGILDMAGRSEAIDGLTGGGTVTNSALGTSSTLFLGANNAGITFTGLLQDGAGRFNLSKGGTGTAVLNGTVNNTYTGTTEITAGTLTVQQLGSLGSTGAGTTIIGNRDQAGAATTLNLNVTTASTPLAPNLFDEPLTLISELSNDQRAGLGNAAESLRITAGIVIEGDGLSQISANQAAGDQFQINGGITGSASNLLFLRGAGEMQLNSVVNTPNVILAKTDAGLLIINAGGHDYREAQFVHGTVRTDVVNALDTGAIVRMGQGGNVNTLDLNGNNQTIAGLVSNVGITDNFARTVTSVAPATLNINTAAASGGDYGYGYSISGAITLQKSGPGDQVLLPSVAGNSLTYTGNTIVSGGTLRLAANDRIPDAAATSNVVVGDGATTAFLDLNGYNDTINGLHGTASGTVHSNGGQLGGLANSVLTLKGTSTPALDATFSGTLKNNTDTGTSTLALIKTGTGTQILAGTNTYTGATTISAGTLLINGNNAGATGEISVASGATLGGSGSLGGALTVADGGIFAPGNGAGTLTTTTSASFGNASVLSYEFLGTDTSVGGANNDLFTGVINLTLDGVLNVNETVAGSFLSASLGNTWRLINYSGTFTNNTLDLGSAPMLSGGNVFAVDTSVSGQVNLVVVPETSSVGLLGLTALLTLRRRRRAA